MPVTRGTNRRDPAVSTATGLFYLGVFGIPILSLRLPGGLAASDLTFGLSAALAAIAASCRRRRLPPNSLWRVAAFLTLCGSVLAMFEAESPFGTLAVEVRMLFLLLVWQWTARSLLDSFARVERALNAFLAGATLSGVVAITQSYFTTNGGRSLGLAQHPNDAGGSLAVAFAMALSLLAFRGGGRWSWRAVVVGVTAVGLILSGSVTGMLAALLGSMFLVFRRSLKPRRVFFLALFGLAIYAAGTTVQSSFLGSEFGDLSPLGRLMQTTGEGDYNTVAPRLESYEAAWAGIRDSPIVGNGLDLGSNVVAREDLTTHNWLLLAWYGGGLPFLAGVLVAAVSVLATKRSLRRDQPLREVLLIGVATASIFAMTAPIMFHRYFWLPFVLILAWTEASRVKTATPTSQPERSGMKSTSQ